MSALPLRLGRIEIVAALAATAWVSGCGEGVGPTGQATDSVIVSNPVPITAALTASLSGAARGAAANEDVVYVSLSPGTVADGQVATVRKVGATNTVTASIVNGGLDPVPVVANIGDNVEIVVAVPGGAPRRLTTVVPARRPPVVVRADPPPKKRDVPLNTAIVVVFNEPVASTTLASGLQLFRGGTPVPGTAELLGGTATAAVFRPSVTLEPNTDYQLSASTAVRDLSGDALTASVTVEFTTGTTFEGAPNSIVVVPDTSEILIGSQLQLTGSARDSSGGIVSGVSFVWVSDNPAVAAVSGAGLVTGLGEGVAHISGGGSITGSGVATVLVTSTLAPVQTVMLSPDTAGIPIGPLGGTVRLAAILRDQAGNLLSFRQVLWSTSDPGVATVSGGSGGRALVTGIAPGKVTVTATSEGKSNTAAITVLRPAPYLRLAPGGPDFYNHGHTCAVTADDWVLCWGANSYGQLGTATPGFAYGPMGVGGMKFSQVAATTIRNCALTSDGAAYCWGAVGIGALGIGTTVGPESCFSACSQTPIAVAGGHRFTSIGVGGEHACGLSIGGTVYCWGYNTGLLGIGTMTGPENCDAYGASGPCSSVPVAVAGTFTALAVGGTIGYHGEHTCALTADSAAYCWGYNSYGQLGDSSTTDRAAPVPVAGGHKFVALSVGDGHTCGLTSDSTAFCWGYNQLGQLGTGTNRGPDACWNPYTGNAADSVCNTTPVQVAGSIRWTAISAGGVHTCATALDGSGYCWGDNGFGQLGDGTTTQTTVPTAVSGGLVFANITAGLWHSCGVTTAGIAYCWGDNGGGRLGDGTTTPSVVPVKVAGQP